LLTATTAIATVGLIAAVPGLVDSGFLGRLDLPFALRLVAHLPLALAALTTCVVPLLVWAWVGHWWSRAVLLQYTALAISATVLAAQLGAWRLIGWGFT
jgi:hypothetical protein